jgi:beta-N-acetylhexosaminidase
MINKNHKSFVCGIKGKYLSNNEKRFLIKYKPWGIILFSRNIKSIKQAKILTNSIKKIFKNENYPILIDQEGGCVTRLKKFIDTSIFSAKFFGDLYKKNNKKFEIYFNVYVKQISYLLKTLGININSVPVLDIRRVKSHNVIGDRSYSSNKKIVSKIGDICIEKFHKNRIATIIKHIPGHGLARSDSHKKLPIINQKIEYLLKNDFQTFKNKKSLIAMTGHLLFKNIDRKETVTHSKKIIKLIRNKIGFKNIIITDDLSMKALKYSLEENVKKSFLAGCNLALHCNANLKEMLIVAKNSPNIDNFIVKKTSQLTEIIS